MPRVKVFTANLGFYETAVAARSRKMALAHWGVDRDLFRDGTAKESNEPRAVEGAMRKVGMVVRRPLGSGGAFEERADAERTLLKTLGGRAKPKPKQATRKRSPKASKGRSQAPVGPRKKQRTRR
jgi:colicin import membrane protein